MKKKKVLPIIENLEISDTGSEGQSLGRKEEMVVFVKNTVPGDVVDVQLTRKKSKYAEGKPILFHSYSDKRVEPKCEHFGVCGGCKWQNMNYQSQLQYKQKQVLNALVRIGKLEIPEIKTIIPSKNIYHYRNKLEFTFSNKKWLTEEQIQSGETFDNKNALGFHIPGMFDKVLDINECHLQTEPSHSIRKEVKRFVMENHFSFYDIREHTGFLRTIIIRTTSTKETMVIPVFAEEDKTNIDFLLNHLKNKFPQITSLMYVINQKKNDTINDLPVNSFSGNDFITEEMEGLKFKIGPKSFYQTNSEQAYELYKVAREFADIKENDIIYDLYTGTGTIANFIAAKAKKVIGIEYIPSATDDAKLNSRINKINNTDFFAGDIKDVLNNDFINANGKPDIIITDPPRVGMHEDVVKKIMEIAPERIVYVSCNPASQARDLAWMSDKYSIADIQPVDMFPQTAHVENVVKLIKR